MNRIMRVTLLGLLVALAVGITAFHAAVRAQEKPAVGGSSEAAIKLLGKMVGGVWKTTGAFKAELRYEWRIPGKAIRGLGKAAIGTPQEFPMESLYGWDDASKKVYYMDFHGHDTVYKGLVQAEGDTLNGDFEGLIGDKGNYRFADTLTDADTISAEMFAKNKAGEWVKIHTMTFKRLRD